MRVFLSDIRQKLCPRAALRRKTKTLEYGNLSIGYKTKLFEYSRAALGYNTKL